MHCNFVLKGIQSLDCFFSNRIIPRNNTPTAAADGEFPSFHVLSSCSGVKRSFGFFLSPKASEGFQFSGSGSHASHQLCDLPKGVRELQRLKVRTRMSMLLRVDVGFFSAVQHWRSVRAVHTTYKC